MKKVVIVGCGVVGAMIAYELSQMSDLQITVLDRQPPAQAATGAALGVLMGIISQKTKGRAWAMRQASIRRYAELLPELAALSSGTEPNQLAWNHQGILKLCFVEDDMTQWQALAALRQQQGWQLELWSPAQIQECCPQIAHSDLISAPVAAVYSPQDYQVDPTALTLALVKAAQRQGVEFRFDVEVKGLVRTGRCERLLTSIGEWSADWVVIAAGLGSAPLAAESGLEIVPVLGQAVRVRLPLPLGDPTFQPVITGHDIHIVPLGLDAAGLSPADYSPAHSPVHSPADYWIGATVEFSNQSGPPQPDAAQLEQVWQGAVGLCPDLAQATRLQSWSGLRPRPHNRPAPIVEPLSGYNRVWLATGHYRNGVLLAPATAQLVRAAIAE
jgi:glycine/D-amino acid oxidase-like deaminating enzyme